MSSVFIVDTHYQPLAPIHPGQARLLLKRGQAAVFRRFPFTLILKRAVEHAAPVPLRLKIDPGSKTTGLAIIDDTSGQVIFAAEVTHRGQQVCDRLLSRRALRRGRRSRHTRYRASRFLNRRRRVGWLPPSLESRLANVTTWVARLSRLCPIGAISQELVKFDTQAMQHPEIAGVEYQQGTRATWKAVSIAVSATNGLQRDLSFHWQYPTRACGCGNMAV
jgi:hypothetical protein